MFSQEMYSPLLRQPTGGQVLEDEVEVVAEQAERRGEEHRHEQPDGRQRRVGLEALLPAQPEEDEEGPHAEDQHLEDLQREEQEEQRPVLLAHAVARPHAVVVESRHAEVAVFAVLRADRLVHVAVLAEVLLEVRGGDFSRHMRHRRAAQVGLALAVAAQLEVLRLALFPRYVKVV